VVIGIDNLDMEENMNVEKITMEDGRHAERHVADSGDVKVTKLYVEESRPLKLESKVTEKSKPVVYERTIEHMDPETGEVLRVDVEASEPEVKMFLRDRIGLADDRSIGSSRYATKEDVVNAVVAGVSEALNGSHNYEAMAVKTPHATAVETPHAMSAQAQIKERVSAKTGGVMAEYTCYGFIILLAAAFGYLLMM